MILIKNGAIFIADAHYPSHGDELINVLNKIKAGEFQTTQLFLMGDIFDLLFGHNRYIAKFSQNAIKLINELSLKLDIYYLEGNHDFCLKEIFPNVKVFHRDEQPICMSMGDKKVGLSHGDKFDSGFWYDVYSNVLRNKITLNILKPFQRWIIDYRIKKLSQKNICHDFIGFEDKMAKIISHYENVDLIIEGHFHQNKEFGKYISLPSLACQKKIVVVKDYRLIYISMV